jgi:4-amino-4-deoxy-L-arabinose transferase-like glycosyltransferase
VVVALAVAQRVYRIAEYTAFQGDQGIDALAARRLLVDHQVLLEGPATSAGGVHLGPAYYYLLALPMLVDWLDPLADAVLMAVLGAAAVGIVFVLARRWFGLWPAVAAAGLFAISPPAIVAARSAWNPAPAPFFTCLALLGLDNARRTNNGRWLLLTGFGLGIVIQLHYFSVAIVGVVTLFSAALVWRHRSFKNAALGGAGVFVLLLWPLIANELLNGFPNLRAAMRFSDATTAQESAARRLYEVFGLGLVGDFLTANWEPVAIVVSVALLFGLAIQRQREFERGLIGALLAATVAQAMLYRGPIFEHYWLPVAPVLFLAFAAALSAVPRTQLVQATAVAALVAINLWSSPLRQQPENQLARTWAVAQQIASAAQGEPFGLWLTTPGESDAAYRFQLERIGRPAAAADGPQPTQLFIICPGAVCDMSQARQQVGADWVDSRMSWQAQIANDEILQLVQDR